MASWVVGGGEHQSFNASLEDKNCLEGRERPAAPYDIGHMDRRDISSPPRLINQPNCYESFPTSNQTWAPRPEQTHIYFVIREQESRSPSPAPPADAWREESSPKIVVPPTLRHYEPVPQHQWDLYDDTFASYRDNHTPQPQQSISPPPVQTSPPPSTPWKNGFDLRLTTQNHALPHDHDQMKDDVDIDSRDDWAARQVKEHFQKRARSSKHERILRSLIHSPSYGEEKLDQHALTNAFVAMNEIFFNGRLTGRVRWEWTDESPHLKLDSRIVGHTLFRESQRRDGFETFIMLQSSILQDPKYTRRLLISAFLHELIHCYLFVECGFDARRCRGHTKGFKEIADLIDNWAGRDILHLCKMEADLERFLIPNESSRRHRNSDEGAVYEYDTCYPAMADVAWEQRINNDRWDHPELVSHTRRDEDVSTYVNY